MPDEIIPDEIVIKTGKVKKYAPYVAAGTFVVGVVGVLIIHATKLQSLSTTVGIMMDSVETILETQDVEFASRMGKLTETLDTMVDK